MSITFGPVKALWEQSKNSNSAILKVYKYPLLIFWFFYFMHFFVAESYQHFTSGVLTEIQEYTYVLQTSLGSFSKETRWWPVQAQVHLAANEFKDFPQRH